MSYLPGPGRPGGMGGLGGGMGGPGGGVRPRAGGGFNAGPGGGFSEHLDENAVQAASQQKQLAQQQADPKNAAAAAQAAQAKAGPAAKPREVGTLADELIKRPAHDIMTGLKSLFDFTAALGVDPFKDSPERANKKRQIHQRMQQLNQEDQEAVHQRYQQLEQRKRQQLQEEEAKKQREAQAQQNQDITPPSSPKKGPVGPGMSKKKQASTRLNQQRQQMGGGAQPKH